MTKDFLIPPGGRIFNPGLPVEKIPQVKFICAELQYLLEKSVNDFLRKHPLVISLNYEVFQGLAEPYQVFILYLP